VRLAKALVPETIKHRWREFRWPASWVSSLPGTSRLYGPARRWVRAEDYIKQHAGRIQTVLAAQAMPALAFKNCGPIPDRFFQRFQPEVPAASILELPEARLIGPDGWIIGAEDSYLVEASFWAYPDSLTNVQDHYMLIPRLARPSRRLPGRTLSLASDFAIGGYGHFIHDSLTRLLLLELAKINPGDFDWIYWPHLDTPAVKSLIKVSGLPQEKILTWDCSHDLVCDSLTATTFPGRPGHIAPPYADFLRRRFAPQADGEKRKLYLSRSGYRRNFRNSQEIEAVFAHHGYEICHPHTDPAVFAKCASSSHVVAIEGANFFNVFACAPGTKVLLILPDAGPTLPYTLTLGLSAQLDMHLLAAQSLDQPKVDPGIADVMLDPLTLSRALDQMLAA